ncbi:lymphocyte cytosolic protein 2a isoform X2 [Parambassis ranga]|uniref:Lymphocyte cytosolic protein 2 n=1 Tax=Parambassis ranga TaxID=210632 RepID=A0A6P7JMQ1_9TELE|nr:lymphocyte cytosolic protein 2-like isoform X2 [Parambassis ranga]
MSSERVPSRLDVMGWSPQQLADYLRRMNLSGCDKVVLKNSISGSRFVNLSENDLQKFPKLHAPMISKISNEISKKEERRGLFGKKSTPKFQEPDMSADVGWAEDEFEEFESDYESPFSGDEDGSGGDYESPNDDQDGGNDYEPPPSEPAEDLAHKLCPTLPIGDGDYIDNTSRGLPPVVCPRPPVSTQSAPPARMPGQSSSMRDPSPHGGARPSGTRPPEPPQIFRGNKPGKGPGSNQSPIRGPQSSTADRPGTQSWRSQQEAPEPPAWSKPPVPPPASASVSRSNSSARPSPSRFDGRREPLLSPQQAQDEAPRHNTFPFHHKSLPPRPGLPGPPSRHGDGLPPSTPSTASLPHRLSSAMAEHKGGAAGSDRPSLRPSPPTAAHRQDLDPRWYLGKVTRGQAEGCLKQVHKDGAYLVRDSTRQLDSQPFTLMVFYQDKVYNIQIRQQNQQFQLGTGLKAQESFPSVGDIISHYSQSPLLLIDAKNRGSGQQNQCQLSEPAGYLMSGQDRS